MAANPLRGYDGTFLECRDIRHVWGVVGYWREPDGLVCRGLVCQRCDTERTDRWDAKTFDRIGSRYSYPTGYVLTMAEGERHTDARAVRGEAARRAKVYANEQTMLDAMTRGNHK